MEDLLKDKGFEVEENNQLTIDDVMFVNENGFDDFFEGEQPEIEKPKKNTDDLIDIEKLKLFLNFL